MDFAPLLAPLGDVAPSGIELRNEPEYDALQRLLEPASRAIRLNPDGSVNDSAAPVEWQRIWDDAGALATKGRDLRLLVMAVRAAAALDGFSGLSAGLDALIQTVDTFWDDLHPALRDRDDPAAAAMPRSNALRQLENDDNGLLGDLRFGPLLTLRGLGVIRGDDLAAGSMSEFEALNRAASGLSAAEKAEIARHHAERVNRVTAASRAFATEQPDAAAAMVAAISAVETRLPQLAARFAAKAGLGDTGGPVFPELLEFAGRCRETLAAGIAHARAESGAAPETPGDSPAPDGEAAPAQVTKPAQGAVGEIVSRDDVEKSLDAIIAFYRKTEPSSPIPHIAERLRRMVKMDFLQLMEEIAPSGLKDFRTAAGITENAKKKTD